LSISLGTISGPSAQCLAVINGSASYSLATVPGATNYFWTVPSGMTITSGQGSTTLNVSWTAQAIHSGIYGTLTVTASTICASQASSTLAIDFSNAPPVAPPSISGAAKVCPGNVIVYSVSQVARASSYTWTTPAGASIISGQGSNVITVSISPAFAGGSISVSASNICGTGPIRTKTLNFNIPNTPAIINGQKNGLCGSSNAMFSTPGAPNATGYVWNVPSGVSITSGQGTNTITVNVGGSFVSGVVTVTGTNGCGNGSPRSFNITGAPGQPTPINGPVAVCPGATNVQYDVATVAGATNYTWTVPGGASIVAGQGTKTILVNFGANPASGQVISVKASNACGQSGSRTLSGITLSFANCGPRIADEQNKMNNVLIFPNPARDNVNLQFNSTVNSAYQIILMDNAGRTLMNEAGEAQEGINMKAINISELSSGIYSVVIRIENESKVTRLLIE